MDDGNGRDRVISDEERARAMLEQLKGVHALDIGRDMVIAAVNFSYPKLGLSDETRPVRDLDDVRLSIELVRGILEVLDREHGAKTADLHDTLAQMQLAYAHAVQLAGAEREPEPATPAQEHQTPGQEAPPAGETTAADAAEARARNESDVAGPAASEGEPSSGEPAAKKAAPGRRAGGGAATGKRAAAKKPTARKKPAARKKPSSRKKPDGEG